MTPPQDQAGTFAKASLVAAFDARHLARLPPSSLRSSVKFGPRCRCRLRARTKRQSAGSASSGSMASSAAPSSGASSPSVAGTTRTRSARRGQGAAVQLGLDGRDDVRRQPREATTEHDEARVEDVDQAGQADAEPAADVVDGCQGRRVARSRGVAGRRPRPVARRRRAGPRGAGGRSSPISVSQQPIAPQRHGARRRD